MEQKTPGHAEGRYMQLSTDRDQYLDRAREAALLTIPSLFPPDGHSSGDKLYRPYQSIGSRGLNNLASKLLMTLAPPNSPFFRLRVNPKLKDQLDEDPEFKTEVEKGLAVYERTVMEDIEASGDRPAIFEGLKHLLCGGNVLLYVGRDGTKAFNLNRFVVRRDPMGVPLEIIVKETFSVASAPDNIKTLLASPSDASDTTSAPTEKTVDVFTHILRKEQQWFVYQEVNGQRVPESEGQYPLERSPWLPLRLIRIDGENYGRGYVEEYFGDLASLEGLSKAIVEGSAAAAKVLFLVKPNGTTNIRTLAKSNNGDIKEGDANDISVVQMDKFADFRMARETMNRIETRLEFAFLLNTAIQRNAERVTAEEIRYMAQEIEDALGGIYSLLSQEFQLPYANRKIAVLQKEGKLKRLPKGVVTPAIVTGLEALGRGHDRNKLVNFLKTIAETVGPEVLLQRMNVNEVIERLAVSDGIDTEGLFLSDEDMAAKQQEAQANQMMQSAGPEAAKQAIGAMMNQQQGNPDAQ